jgi:hypothetical protein
MQTANGCAEICRTCSHLVNRESYLEDHLRTLCAEVCTQCAVTPPGSIAMDCAAACRRYAEACAKFGLSGPGLPQRVLKSVRNSVTVSPLKERHQSSGSRRTSAPLRLCLTIHALCVPWSCCFPHSLPAIGEIWLWSGLTRIQARTELASWRSECHDCSGVLAGSRHSFE